MEGKVGEGQEREKAAYCLIPLPQHYVYIRLSMIEMFTKSRGGEKNNLKTKKTPTNQQQQKKDFPLQTHWKEKADSPSSQRWPI